MFHVVEKIEPAAEGRRVAVSIDRRLDDCHASRRETTLSFAHELVGRRAVLQDVECQKEIGLRKLDAGKETRAHIELCGVLNPTRYVFTDLDAHTIITAAAQLLKQDSGSTADLDNPAGRRSILLDEVHPIRQPAVGPVTSGAALNGWVSFLLLTDVPEEIE